MTVKYEFQEWGKRGEPAEIRIVRISRPTIIDKAGRKQWQKESESEVRDEIAIIPFTDLPALLLEIATFTTYFIPDEPVEEV